MHGRLAPYRSQCLRSDRRTPNAILARSYCHTLTSRSAEAALGHWTYHATMRSRQHNLAIESSSRYGSLALGCGATMLEEVTLPAPQRQRVDLMPAIDELCRRHAVVAGDLGQLYVSIGPGSFTGLRIGIATAQLLSQVLQLDVVAVATLDVVARNACDDAGPNLAVCLNPHGDTIYRGLYRREDDGWIVADEPGLVHLDQVYDATPRPLALIADLLDRLPQALPADVTVLPAELAKPHARHVWQVGRSMAAAGRLIEPARLLPLYARAPEAEQQWNRRYGESATIQTRRSSASEVS
jgi:tRNA threonylcarbamoyladenosine biosynthesis protein TsaB